MSILNTADTQFYFDVIDGWGGNLDTGGAISDSVQPDAVHRYNPTSPSSTDPLARGTIVMSTYTANTHECQIPLTDTNVDLDADNQPPNRFWMVVEGNTEFDYSSRLGKNKVVLLRGNFTVKTAHVNGALSPGDKVSVENDLIANPGGKLPSAGGTNTGRLRLLQAGETPFGFVTDKETIDGVDVYTVEMSL